MSCPHHPQEPETDFKYCRQCGMPTSASPQESAAESAAEHESAAESPAPNPTSRIGTLDLSSQSPAQPVVRLAKPDGEDPEPDAPVDAPAHEPAPREPPPTEAGARRRASGRALRAADVAHYRSVQKLSRAIVVIHVSTMAAFVGLALVFVFSLKRWADTTVELSRESATASCRSETLRARLEESNSEVAELKEANVRKDGELVRKSGEIGETKAELRKIRDERDEARLALLSLNLDEKESRRIDKGLNAILARVKARTAGPELAAHKSEIELLQRKVRRGENRPVIVRDYKRLLNKLDEQVQAQLEDTVGRPLMGE